MQILLIGLGREGWSSFQFCLGHLPAETIFSLVDDQPRSSLGENWQTAELDQLVADNKIQFFTTTEFVKLQSNFDRSSTVAIVSPGVAPEHPLVEWLDRSGIPQTSNTQLFFDIAMPDRATVRTQIAQFLPKLNHLLIVIGVTGTKGKSTTATAIHHVLQHAGLTSVLGGNIGVPPLDLVPTLQSSTSSAQYVVLELSAHQLNRLTTSPQIAVVLAITPEHLDYYTNFDDYVSAKTRICEFQHTSDLVIYVAEDKTAEKVANLSPGKKLRFSATIDTKADATLTDTAITFGDKSVIECKSLKVIGRHTIANLLPSVLISSQLGVSPQVIQEALTSFSGLPHRLQLVAKKNRVRYYNDSLATTPEATIAAIKAFGDRAIILIAGGFDRGLDYSQLSQAIAQSSVKAALLLPTTGEKIARSLAQAPQANLLIEQVPSLQIAIERAKQLAQPGNIVLLSPASASFNQFKDYAERGEAFVRLVTNHT